MKKILIVINYYYPYISGMTEVARIVSEAFYNSGYEVTVLTSNHAKLPKNENIKGVKVIRAPIIGRISKGTISPAFIFYAIKLSRRMDIVNLHLPMIESGIISFFVNQRKIAATYQCDINLPTGFFNSLIIKLMDMSNNLCLKRARKVIVTSIDYARHSRITKKHMGKLFESGGPVKDFGSAIPRKTNGKIIGFCGRIVEEKGIDVLLKAFKIINETRKDTRLVIAGDYENVAGGSIYPQMVSYIQKNNLEHVSFIGKIPEEEMYSFYTSLDVFVLPSINSLEAFGLVQLEAMYCGIPVVASNLPGVRTIIQNTGMGLLCESGDAYSLAECIVKILDNPYNYIQKKSFIQDKYSTEKLIEAYRDCFERL